MDKFQLLNKLKEDLEKKGYKIAVSLNKPKSNPLFEITQKNNKAYITLCEAGIKPVIKYEKIVFCGISPLIQSLIEIEKTYVVIIDFQPTKPRYVLAKLDSTNYRWNKINYIIFDFKRPMYGDFFNTESLPKFIGEIHNIIEKS